MGGLGNLLAQPCSLSLHFASQDVLVYPAPHEDPSPEQLASHQQKPPPGPDTTLSGVVEVYSPSDRTIQAIKIILKNSQTIAIHDPAAPSSHASIRYEDSCTFSRTIEISAENHVKQRSHGKHAQSRAGSRAGPGAATAAADGRASTSAATSATTYETESTAGIFLSKGMSYFSFTFILPATLPPTTRSKYGRLRYACTAIAIGGGRARSNITSQQREVFVIALPQPESLASAAQGRSAFTSQTEGFNAPGMPTPIPLDVQFHDFHEALGIISVSLTSLSLTVGAIATLSIYHPSPPSHLNVHLIRVSLEQTSEVYNRLRRSWMRLPVEKFRLWEAGHMPYKKADDQPIRPRRLGTVTAALAGHYSADPSPKATPSDATAWPFDAGALRRASEWDDSIWIAGPDGSKGRPGNAILDRLYVNPAEAAAAAAHVAQEARSAPGRQQSFVIDESSTSLPRRPDAQSSSYFGSRPSSPSPAAPPEARKSRSVPTTPGAGYPPTSHARPYGNPSHAHATAAGGKAGMSLFPTSDIRPHPDPLYATACDNCSMPYLSAISGAWVDRPVVPARAPSASKLTAPQDVSTDTTDEGPNAYRLRALLRLPSDDVLHPTSLRGTRSDIHFTHEVAIEIFFSRSDVLFPSSDEHKEKSGKPKVQVFSMRKNVTVQSCAVTPDMVHLPPYGGHEPGRASASSSSHERRDSLPGGVGVGEGLPTYLDATSQPSTRPASLSDREAIQLESLPSASEASTSHAHSGAAQRGRPGFFRRLSGPASSSSTSSLSRGPEGAGSRTETASQDHAQPLTHTHIRQTLSSILHPQSHAHHHVPRPASTSSTAPPTASAGARTSSSSNLATAAAAASHHISGGGGGSEGSRQHAAPSGAVRMSTATAPPSRAPSRAASRESSPTRAGGRSGAQTPPVGGRTGQVGAGAGTGSGLDRGVENVVSVAGQDGAFASSHLSQNPTQASTTATGSSSSSGPVILQPQPQHHHHYRRNEFAFGFTPSSARRGEGEDSDSHHGHGYGGHRAERHAHFIPAQVVGRDRGERERSVSSSRIVSGVGSSSGSVSPSILVVAGAGPQPRSAPQSVAGGEGSGNWSSEHSSGQLSRRASAGPLNGTSVDSVSSSSAQTGLPPSGAAMRARVSDGEAPTPARLENALRQLQLSQVQAQRSQVSGSNPTAYAAFTVINAGPRPVPLSLSAPASGASTPGGTLLNSGPFLPPEWDLVMAPGERTSMTHSMCMCGRTTESLLRAERMLLVGAPTAPYFTPSASRPPSRPATPGLSQRASAASLLPESAPANLSAVGPPDGRFSNGGTSSALAGPSTDIMGDSPTVAARVAQERSQSYGQSQFLAAHDVAAAATNGGSGASPGLALTPSDEGGTANIGADDPEGVLWAEGMGSDGRPGGARRPQLQSSVGSSGGSVTTGCMLRRSDSTPDAVQRGDPSSSAQHDTAGDIHGRVAERGRDVFGGPGPPLSNGQHAVLTPTAQSAGCEGEQQERRRLFLPALEDLMPADEFVLARGRDPDEILRRKADLMST